ncbi:MAG: GNAT family N-acetyltransferase [Dehalococcoidales bacterium]|nr:GNAT family N-acetyltransferase [Dehalococcoidales bacterium]
MNDSPYIIRNYTRADFNRFVLAYLCAERTEPIGRPCTPQAIVEKKVRPGYHPERDIFLAEAGGEVIGFLDVLAETGIDRLIVDAWIAPDYRKMGIGEKLLDIARHRARDNGITRLHVNVREDNEVSRAVLSGLGFTCVRSFRELEIDIRGVDSQVLQGAMCECRYLQEGEEAVLADIQNRSFSEHWGYNPDTAGSIEFRLSLSHRSHRDIILRCEDDSVTGYCWTDVTGDGRGRIFMIGSDPKHRGRGIGRKLLMAGMANLRNNGIQTVWLTVDSDNTAALSLYDSVGFTQKTNYLWYEASAD